EAMKKVLLILVDGMRPDALEPVACVKDWMERSSYTMDAQTVFPSVTLPCHMSLMHSVDPQRHGTTTNTHTPQVRPIDGLFDVLHAWKKNCGFFYNWEQLRDLGRPGSLQKSYYVSGALYGYDQANALVVENALDSLRNEALDFTFVYLGEVDEVGHKYGWMNAEYQEAVQRSWRDIHRLAAEAGEDCTIIITADHGGHDRTHGTQQSEDMTIPVFLCGAEFVPGRKLENVSIKDLAPTICTLLGVPTASDWEGHSLV
ncbi:MAG: alkaline phosphatase family protein, partial [Oscillospiraceae bacterium]|nr:alkaline phosphatase family protein [Oscillospiraceae bacterium]